MHVKASSSDKKNVYSAKRFVMLGSIELVLLFSQTSLYITTLTHLVLLFSQMSAKRRPEYNATLLVQTERYNSPSNFTTSKHLFESITRRLLLFFRTIQLHSA